MDINDRGTTCKKSIPTKTATNIPDTIISEGVKDTKQKDRNITITTGIMKRAPPLKATACSHANTNTVSSCSSSISAMAGSDIMAVSFKGASTLCTPSTPRIELSRASSSSHHEEDSRDSSPENVFEQVIYVKPKNKKI